jgi:hypothetical protein
METFYTINEIAAMWKISRDKVIRLVDASTDPTIMELRGDGLIAGTAKRPYVTRRIPESALARLRQSLAKQPRPVLTIKRVPRKVLNLSQRRVTELAA